MRAERQSDKSVRIFVPASSYRELFSEGNNVATDLVVKLNIKEVAGYLVRAGLVSRGDPLLVSFVSVKGVDEDSPGRSMKFIQAFKNESGHVVDVFIRWLSYELPLLHNN